MSAIWPKRHQYRVNDRQLLNFATTNQQISKSAPLHSTAPVSSAPHGSSRGGPDRSWAAEMQNFTEIPAQSPLQTDKHRRTHIKCPLFSRSEKRQDDGDDDSLWPMIAIIKCILNAAPMMMAWREAEPSSLRLCRLAERQDGWRPKNADGAREIRIGEELNVRILMRMK